MEDRNRCSPIFVAHLLDAKSLLLLVRGLQSLPGIFRRDLTNFDAIQGEEAVGIAISSDVALGLADAADLRALVRAVGLAVARLAAATALACELTFNPLVSAVGGVVTRLVAVVAESRVCAFLLRLRTVTGEVTLGVAAARNGQLCQESDSLGLKSLLATTAIASASVLGDVLAKVAGVVVVVSAASSCSRLRCPGGVRSGIIGREAAVASGHCAEH